ncbi:Chaperone DnaJ-domain superfamily protein, putative isoform 1 [Theobroma cacao]|uniref:Chaperone DnaJ-domain superfamily protein, putative isoform 1 n=1 Tax=Theobroma cacao TaxID=3641 RepID=A0A061FGC8_THECC|nr:Chaperone DnaJ-domain superfamily protein, putative isoform 1 [Theobroma cacao]
MDQFGVLTERYGLKPQGKSAPMSQAKRPTATATSITSTNQNFGFDTGLNGSSMPFSSKSSWNSNPSNGSLLDDHDFFSNQKPQNSFGLGDDYGYAFGAFENTTKKQSNTSNNSSNGSSFDLDSMLFNSGPKSSSTNLYVVDDLFGGMPGSENSSNDDIIGSFASSTKQKGSAGDLLGDFSGVAAKLKSSSRKNSWDWGKTEAGFDDLIPGFGGSSPPANRTNIKTTKSTFKSTEDPFVVLESASSSAYNSSETPTDPLEEFSMLNESGGSKLRGSSNASRSLRPPPKPAQVLKADKVKSSGASPIDELEDFAMGRVFNKASRSKEAEDVARKNQEKRADDLESFFGVSSRSNSAPKSRATTLDPMFDAHTHQRQQKTSPGASSTAKKSSPATMMNGVDDLSSIFGAAPMFGEFEEVDGESEERRRARLGRHQRTQDRVARAVADMNQRDRQTQHEQEERRRIAEAMDFEIKRWAAGKEGNVRALLSSLQQVLWPECGWEPISLTDLITSGSVKKVYRKATLCVHPDKVQQKGATLEQKYIAEKVFDILKEASNKFNKEELS